MKRLFFIGIAIIFLVMAISIPVSAQSKSGKKMIGVSVIPSFDGPGLGFRVWETPTWGWSLQAMPSWEFNDITAQARLMKTLSTKENARWYGLLTAGYARYDESEEIYGVDFSYKISMPTFGIGIGWEKLFGIRKNKGLSLEAGYQYGKADYEIDYEVKMSGFTFKDTIKDTFKVFPIYIGAQFAFYRL